MSFGSKSSSTPARPEPVTTAIPQPKPATTPASASRIAEEDPANTKPLLSPVFDNGSTAGSGNGGAYG